MQRALFPVAAIFLAALLAGCPPAYPKCNSDEHCTEKGEVCVQGQCQECATDENCKSGFTCQGNKCVPKPECAADGDCPAGQKCGFGRCFKPECEQDGDCAPGLRCRESRCVTAGGCTSNEDCPSGQVCQNGACTAAGATGAGGACDFGPVRFAFNEASLDDDARNRLRTLADCIKSQNLKVTLEGHADERGTEEYNLQLSNRRAASVRKYLVDLGVPAGRLKAVGYGETRPSVEGSSEAAWAANRRVELKR